MRIRTSVAAFVAVLLAGAALPVGAATGATAIPAASAGRGYVSADEVRQGAPIHGMIIADANRSFDANLTDLRRLAADGVNQVTLYATWYFDSTSSSSISAGPFTPTDAEVSNAIDLAHQAGLTVQLDPILWSSPTGSDGYHWRGLLDPADPDTFWTNYDALVMHYAELAQSDGVEVFAIGSELRALESYTAQWRYLADSVRAVYGGELTYMGLTASVRTIRFWRSVDYIGVSPYYWLSGDRRPTYRKLKAAWGQWFDILRKRSQRVDRPVLFNEIGYLSAERSAAEPWKAESPYPPSQTVQARAYAALLDAARSQDWLHGIIFYKWTTSTGPTDKSWTPRGKRAECVLAKRWAAADSPRLPDGQPVGCLGARMADIIGAP